MKKRTICFVMAVVSFLVWKGELEEAPQEPELNWAYFNTTDKTTYIWNGNKWDILAAIENEGKYVALDLSSCGHSASNSGAGVQ